MQRLGSQYRKAFLTGGRSGLGRAFLDMLLDEGVEVWATSRDAASLPQRPNLHPVSLDLSDPGAVRATVEELLASVPDFDLLINNAGYGVFAPFEEMHPEDVEGQLQVLLHGPIAIAQSLYQQMVVRGKGGAIVNVSSLAGQFPIPLMTLYDAAKAGLTGFSKSLALEADRHGIAVVDFQPGDFNTSFNEAMVRSIHADAFQGRLWSRLEYNLLHGPSPEVAVRVLKRALRSKGARTAYTGGIFQAKLAPFLARFAPDRFLRGCIKRYFGIR